MRARHHGERGDTLVEVLLALVIIALVVTALFESFTTASNASTGNQRLVTADTLLRNYAEAAKSAVRDTCAASSTFTTTISVPPGYTVTGDTNQCPASVTTTQQVNITVTMPNTSSTRTMSILVRRP